MELKRRRIAEKWFNSNPYYRFEQKNWILRKMSAWKEFSEGEQVSPNSRARDKHEDPKNICFPYRLTWCNRFRNLGHLWSLVSLFWKLEISRNNYFKLQLLYSTFCFYAFWDLSIFLSSFLVFLFQYRRQIYFNHNRCSYFNTEINNKFNIENNCMDSG